MKEKYQGLGYMGHFGFCRDAERNARTITANKLVDIHNSKINTFNTKKENEDFHFFMINKINSIFKNIKVNKMKKWKPWEYFILRSADITPEGLQALGDKGWKFKFGYNDNTELVFAREKRIINHFK